MKLRHIDSRDKRNEIINKNKIRMEEIDNILKKFLSKDRRFKLIVERSRLKRITDDLEEQNKFDDCKKFENTTPIPETYKTKKKEIRDKARKISGRDKVNPKPLQGGNAGSI